ncbi:MAG: MMPL family transporter [Desulfobacterales bacterium]|nr:MMPL family transporter [Desulfobacterales bacterium]
MQSDRTTNLPLLFFVLAIAAGLFAAGWHLIRIDTDIVSSLPQDDPVIQDAMYIFKHHPYQDQLTIDLELAKGHADDLVACALAVEAELRASGLFKSVGMEDVAKVLPQLAQSVAERLPMLFTRRELEERVRPLLEPRKVARRVDALQQGLLQMDGIGQAGLLALDPLGLKDLVLARMINLAPTQSARIYKGHLLSSDGRHVLLTAVPKVSGTDGASARQLAAYLEQLGEDFRARFAGQGLAVRLTPVGAYRAALDNEVIVRADVQKAVFFSTLGIALLLLLAFPRPWIGLLSLVPALVGTMVAFFVFALLRPSISILVLGFGGAIISIAVDQGIAYLLFLDRPQETFGKEAAHEIWSVGLLAELTTVGALTALMLSDFPIFRQLGLFSALGSCFAFLFVHTIFPLIFPSLPASRERGLPLPRVADRLFSFGKTGAVIALLLFGGLLLFAKPNFDVNLSAMNTVSQATRAAEAKLTATWGEIFSKIFLMTEADSLAALQDANDRLLVQLEADPEPALLAQAFLPSMIFPGSERSAANLAAWKEFWTAPRVAELKQTLSSAGIQAGFTPQAFDPFFALLDPSEARLPAPGIPAAFRPLVGVAEGRGDAPWRQFAGLILPRAYTDSGFYDRYRDTARIFDPNLFSKRLGHLLFDTFVKLLAIIGAAVAILLLVFFLDVGLTLMALAPVLFAMVCSLGTLSLLGRPLDIPALILAVIVLGTGIDYSLFVVRSYQRYGRARHPAFTLIRSAVVMSACSTLIGFGVMAMAQHALLQSAGIAGALGIGYSLLGAFLILPPLLKWRFETPRPLPPSADLAQRIRARYARMEPNARMFARFKLQLDPMFRELPEQLACFAAPPRTLVDIGTGYGVPACWLAETFPGVKLYGIEPSADRVRVSSQALGADGTVVRGAAPDLPPISQEADGAFMLDMLHYLNDDHLALTLVRLHGHLKAGAPLVIRAVMWPTRPRPWSFWLDQLKNRRHGLPTWFRSLEALQALLTAKGFTVEKTAPSGTNGELLWLCARRSD